MVRLRSDGRGYDELRPVSITRNFTKYAEGSVLIAMGDTKVICTASVEDGVPPWRRGSGEGWSTAEYAMLPRATPQRNARESSRGRPGGRTMEIQRLIGRSLRSVLDLGALGERTVWIDCDVIQADGGTRTAAITGGFVALFDALAGLKEQGVLQRMPLRGFLSAVSVGLVDGTPRLDLNYEEDSVAQVDMNVVATGDGRIVEVQGTGEASPFTREELDQLLNLALQGIEELTLHQREALGDRAAWLEENPS